MQATKTSASLPVEVVPAQTSELLLRNFPDMSEPELGSYEEQSGLWSPPLRLGVFLSSSGRMVTEQEMSAKIRPIIEGMPQPQSQPQPLPLPRGGKAKFNCRSYWCF